MSTLQLQGILSEPEQEADSCLILLHGLGASGHDFEAVLPYFRHGISHPLRCIFPNSPKRAVTINQGIEMPAWYDFALNGDVRDVNQAHLKESSDAVAAVIQGQIEQGIDSKRIILAGFSQGGAIAYDVALNYDFDLAGLLAMSTYIPDAIQDKNRDLDIHVFHGREDDVVPAALGQDSLKKLNDAGYTPSWSEYDMAHEMCLQQIEDINQTINELLAK
ncbi:alpha/beta fold hydrolase [Bermanella marisrubri]|uniref:Predicted esterase n=1 Tax=Bermanella marisrubri TaxID=207949 RepID=Q1N1D7_9GAMM|nr:alpha/beta fold hydrolase [Bermanella marisrubri]EAT12113.1 predicted esterase [Oceanobacter sp. RED65] [Bermanella marisrubri]QIZ83576.1 alpha/beta fold hydrolase [Bermanella marisrubri]